MWTIDSAYLKFQLRGLERIPIEITKSKTEPLSGRKPSEKCSACTARLPPVALLTSTKEDLYPLASSTNRFDEFTHTF